jgi:predicted flap endonuclease-1-like 5' DNA nuclease
VSEREVQIRDLTSHAQEAEAGQAGQLASLTAEATPPRAVASLVRGMPFQADDLKCIEGIGPKMSALLQAADITTFAQLAATDINRLQGLLRDNRWTFADPTTWPEQASLAAAGDWQALEVLQGELKGGRRV